MNIEKQKEELAKLQNEHQKHIIENYIETKKTQYKIYKIINPNASVAPTFDELELIFQKPLIDIDPYIKINIQNDLINDVSLIYTNNN